MYLADGLSASTLTDMSWAEWHEIFYIFSVIYNDLRHRTSVSTDEKKFKNKLRKRRRHQIPSKNEDTTLSKWHCEHSLWSRKNIFFPLISPFRLFRQFHTFVRTKQFSSTRRRRRRRTNFEFSILSLVFVCHHEHCEY